MAVLLWVLKPLHFINDYLLRFGRMISIAAIGLMVAIILVQVFFRYILNNALPWPDEAARFLMLWMTGLMAPSAYRTGGFVSIDFLSYALPKPVDVLLALMLLCMSLVVLVIGLQFGYKHTSTGWLFSSSSLKIPLDWIGYKIVRVKLAWMYMSLFVGLVLLLMVNVELILRCLVRLFGGEDELLELTDVNMQGAE